MNKTHVSRAVLSALACLLAAGHSSAEVTFWTQTPNSVPGYVTNDLYLTGATPEELMGRARLMEIVTELDELGSIYQHPFGGTLPPSGALVAAVPELEFDTFIAMGSTTTPGKFGEPIVVGGPTVIGISAPTFTSDTVEIAWTAPNMASGFVPVDPPVLIARLTLADDASGQLTVLGTIAGAPTSGGSLFDFVVVDGVVVPEPTSVVPFALVLGFFVLSQRRFVKLNVTRA